MPYTQCTALLADGSTCPKRHSAKTTACIDHRPKLVFARICGHIQLNGKPCTHGYGPQFNACHAHRPRAESRITQPCSLCTLPTPRASGICCRAACMTYTQYTAQAMRELRARRKLISNSNNPIAG